MDVHSIYGAVSVGVGLLFGSVFAAGYHKHTCLGLECLSKLERIQDYLEIGWALEGKCDFKRYRPARLLRRVIQDKTDFPPGNHVHHLVTFLVLDYWMVIVMVGMEQHRFRIVPLSVRSRLGHVRCIYPIYRKVEKKVHGEKRNREDNGTILSARRSKQELGWCMPGRSRTEIYAEILECCRNGCIASLIIHKCNLKYPLYKESIEFLKEKNLIE